MRREKKPDVWIASRQIFQGTGYFGCKTINTIGEGAETDIRHVTS